MRVALGGVNAGFAAASERRHIPRVTRLRHAPSARARARARPLRAAPRASSSRCCAASSRDDWDRPTACALWSVRDIAAHLLDDDLRRLSFHRDGQPPPAAVPIERHSDAGGVRQPDERGVGGGRAADEPPRDRRPAGGHRAVGRGPVPRHRSVRAGALGGDLGGRGASAALVRRGPRLHRALAAPAADPRRGRRAAADRARVAASRARSVRSGAAGRVSGDRRPPRGARVRVAIEGAAGGDWTLRRERGRLAPLRRRGARTRRRPSP